MCDIRIYIRLLLYIQSPLLTTFKNTYPALKIRQQSFPEPKPPLLLVKESSQKSSLTSTLPHLPAAPEDI